MQTSQGVPAQVQHCQHVLRWFSLQEINCASLDRSPSWEFGLRGATSQTVGEGLAYLHISLGRFMRPFEIISAGRNTASWGLFGHPGAAPNCFLNHPLVCAKLCLDSACLLGFDRSPPVLGARMTPARCAFATCT